MRNNPVCWFEIYVNDMARAKTFYEGVLQVRLQKLSSGDLEMWAFDMDGETVGAGGALVRMPGFTVGVGGSIVYFACQDCAVEEGRVEEFGGKIQRNKMSIGQYGFISLAVDTEGNMIGFYSQQ